MKDTFPCLPNALAKSGLLKPLPISVLGLVPVLLTPFIPVPPSPKGVPGTLLLGIAGKEAIESAMPGTPLRRWSTAV